MNIAPLGKRVIAFGIDEIILATLFTIVLLVIDEPEIMAAAQSGSNLEIQKVVSKFLMQYVVIKFLYHTIFVYLYGASLGKLAVKIYCVRADGGAMDIATAVIRAAVRVISETIFYMGFLVAFFTNSRQCLHDMAAKTLVVEIEKE
ncbi:RDD family protein [uncultured Campylobacter sp.]|uniref:RDD family protein n=1 Tax=uncultured Campylobacter sp. TaxID=218934 RepID=UPI002613C892|nr:RDD family protein [uncultured Campylobacter sp.]